MNPISRVLRKNLSAAQLAGFILSNFIGLAIVTAGVQFYSDVRALWENEDSFIRKDYLVVNKKVTSANTLGSESSAFSPAELSDLASQPWVRKTGSFTAADYKVSASIEQGGRGLSTFMFFESIPDGFIDVADAAWGYREGDAEVPLIISKDYLTLYNFGFATSSGMPQMSESMLGSIPMTLHLRSEAGDRELTLRGRVVGFSNRLNTILVPKDFMDYTNRTLGSGRQRPASRVIIDVSSPGDVAIKDYLESHGLELAGDKSSSSASYLLNVITGLIVGVGALVTLLSLFILMLSISLLMQKNRDKLHALLMLGYPLRRVAAPYCKIVAISCSVAFILSVAVMFVARSYYQPAVAGLGEGGASPLGSIAIALVLTLAIIALNVLAVRRKVEAAWRL